MMANSENVLNKSNLILNQDISSMNKVQHEYWERIQTYLKDQKWVKMPIELSPPFCAQYGWRCLDTSLLECVTCKAKLSAGKVKIENISYKTCIQKIIEDLKTCHKKYCPWPLTPTPETFIKMLPLSKEEAFKQFSRRVKQLLPFKSYLPLIEDKIFDNLGLDEQHITSLCQMVEINKEEISHFERAVIILAAAGWTLDLEKSKGEIKYITCYDCQRSTSLFLFKIQNTNGILVSLDDSNKNTEIKDSQNLNQTSHVESINGNNSNISSEQQQENGSELINHDKFDEPEPKKKKFSLVCFDPLYEHRPWCLWLLTDEMCFESKIKSQEKNEDETFLNLPGWKIFIKCLLQNIVPDSNTETPISKKDLKSAKEMLETWVTSE